MDIQRGSTNNGYVGRYASRVINVDEVIGDYAFKTIDGMHYMTGYIGEDTKLTLPENYQRENYNIGERAFAGCSSLTSITIPEGVTSIGSDAFSNCSSLTFITIPESVTSIGSGAFACCHSLTTINIPKNVTSIGKGAFDGCSNLTDINIPENSQLTSIGSGAFSNCSNLTFITIPVGVTSIEAFANCCSLKSITIPEGVTSIGDYAFADCESLTDITIPESVTSIGKGAFSDCCSLATITIPTEVTSIGSYTFYNCSSLATITIPEGVTSIGSYAFYNCSSLTAITCKATTPPTINSSTFDNVDKFIPVYMSASSVEAYQSAEYWSEFTNIIGVNKCTTPTISYNNGKVELTCTTEGAEVKTNVMLDNAAEYIDLEFDFIPTVTFTAYATKEQYDDSEVVTLTLCWIPCDGQHITTDAVSITSTPVIISNQNGTITLSGLADDTEVAAYDLAGRELITATATDGTVELATGLEVGSTAVVKIGNNSIKIAVK